MIRNVKYSELREKPSFSPRNDMVWVIDKENKVLIECIITSICYFCKNSKNEKFFRHKNLL